ncbi:hypothetical protein HBI56_163310 [Parastagonospora nodorum]|uniref:Uncharacterized protein n=1 Tax=Phaeosphaeria nodorum (strain SN15 / ATCC MYA-4574 / FGSC 10173) TaxID=321614 RepID=A0A7U2I9R4_PHANO|nr:hypothetical protein HBH56_125590 [Parastagonospora nodorum]QRD05856.1 hypothetical protein JI435_132870 [Parastagonospora nodorum SN15]KAH3931635.1 hypothetical protein HBH54_097920 [Parastagonospora nodorum]KAH3944349.1 hypothetical protein HBH53_159400 [Parastagonospora nodorum]KAH3956866.1 hypothetical protein HBH51_233900 [Parastagonospora nodorum]
MLRMRPRSICEGVSKGDDRLLGRVRVPLLETVQTEFAFSRRVMEWTPKKKTEAA